MKRVLFIKPLIGSDDPALDFNFKNSIGTIFEILKSTSIEEQQNFLFRLKLPHNHNIPILKIEADSFKEIK